MDMNQLIHEFIKPARSDHLIKQCHRGGIALEQDVKEPDVINKTTTFSFICFFF